jgi:hypothetical protein
MAKTRVALFIDAENASAKYVSEYLARCHELGTLTISRCYGGAAGLKKWEKAMAEHHIMPMQTPPSASKENASDFALTIDAVSLLHRGLFDHAVVASSDADFIQLAIHIREQGKDVDGIGESKASSKLQKAFNKFTIIPATPAKKTRAAKSPPKPAAKSGREAPIDAPLLQKLYDEIATHGRVTLRQFGGKLGTNLPRGYRKGHGTLADYLKNSGLFEVSNGIVSRK